MVYLRGDGGQVCASHKVKMVAERTGVPEGLCEADLPPWPCWEDYTPFVVYQQS